MPTHSAADSSHGDDPLFVNSLAKGFAVLHAFGESRRALGLTEMRLVFLARLIRRSPDTRLKYLTGWMRRCYWLCAALHE